MPNHVHVITVPRDADALGRIFRHVHGHPRSPLGASGFAADHPLREQTGPIYRPHIMTTGECRGLDDQPRR
jgi:hypothetical protein